MPKLPSLMEMLKAGIHFGHQKSRWHPKMEPYIFGVRSGVHIIDLDKTLVELEKALNYVKTISAQGKTIVFVGTKQQARPLIKAAAEKCGSPYLTERWIGGLITNFNEFKRRMKKYKDLKAMFETGEIEKYTKKEQSVFQKQIIKLDKYLSGLTNLEKLPDALFIADLRVEKTALAEAIRMKVPMVAVCDTNVNPTDADYPIPANDDAVHSIEMIAGLIAEAINEGKVDFEKNKAAIQAELAKQKVVAPQFVEQAAIDIKTKSAFVKSGAEDDKNARRALRKEEVV